MAASIVQYFSSLRIGGLLGVKEEEERRRWKITGYVPCRNGLRKVE
jgi:hypothetical protein